MPRVVFVAFKFNLVGQDCNFIVTVGSNSPRGRSHRRLGSIQVLSTSDARYLAFTRQEFRKELFA